MIRVFGARPVRLVLPGSRHTGHAIDYLRFVPLTDVELIITSWKFGKGCTR
ncbi:hypothetical protein V7x_21410 [Crateriforma conspicua]|uniref:Uncharacterized protein n=1 Tax=Crateriforma conspicua TaxID=2527996 RepID=A0A5C6FW77_9PLAN|nr:hypothetical protein V7x_21410 [Crateriforma conspicua]